MVEKRFEKSDKSITSNFSSKIIKFLKNLVDIKDEVRYVDNCQERNRKLNSSDNRKIGVKIPKSC